ncbi:hypothetical protein HN51_036733, partial [Arachis hypogaea]
KKREKEINGTERENQSCRRREKQRKIVPAPWVSPPPLTLLWAAKLPPLPLTKRREGDAVEQTVRERELSSARRHHRV